MRNRWLGLLFVIAAGVPAAAQDESRLHAEFRGEGERLKAACEDFDFKWVVSCGYELFTDQPLHVAFGTIAPQDGVGFGPAFVTHWTPNERWRLNWDVDAVRSPNASWRAGVYMKAIYIPEERIVVRPGAASLTPVPHLTVHEYPVLNVYTQAISLNELTYFGLGPTTTTAGQSVFGMREIISGANLVWPIFSRWQVSLSTEANGRFVDLRGAPSLSSSSIEQIYTEATAPGLTQQPAYAQFAEGIRVRPALWDGHLRLNYLANYQQYVAAGDASFQRITVDLSHQIPLYSLTRMYLPREANGPDDCSQSESNHRCPSITRDREGSVDVRLLLSESIVPSGHIVPFYLDPTLGGSDINGNLALGAYQDYRFRAPNLLLLHADLEHSIYGPVGGIVSIDEGKVALSAGQLDFSQLVRSYSVGLTLRGGGLPAVWLVFAGGGREGTRVIATISPSLLGGGARPSLY